MRSGDELGYYAGSEIHSNHSSSPGRLAALGLTKKQTFYVVAIWKHLTYDEAPSAGTFKFTEIGWDYYNDHYSTPTHSLTPFIQLGIPGSIRILSSSP